MLVVNVLHATLLCVTHVQTNPTPTSLVPPPEEYGKRISTRWNCWKTLPYFAGSLVQATLIPQLAPPEKLNATDLQYTKGVGSLAPNYIVLKIDSSGIFNILVAEPSIVL